MTVTANLSMARVGISVWFAGAALGVTRVLFDKTLSADAVGLLMLAILAFPALLALCAACPAQNEGDLQ